MLGKLVHISVDVLILSALLAGIRRSTGITPSSSQIPNKDVRKWFQNYLEFGEYTFDFIVVFAGRSRFFERSR